VIDDNSPDGTGRAADELTRSWPGLEVIHRPVKEGLGPAYIAGFRHALATGAQYVVEIDCDFSHDPADVPRLLAAAGAGADLVLGSRYTPGGRVENWSGLRRLVSAGGSWYARAVLGVAVRDLTGGFKCFSRRALEVLDLDAISARGYAFQIETTYRVIQAGLTVVEVPIAFVDRRAGESKMSRRIVAEAIWRVPALRLSRRGGYHGHGG
jgi:dolichol-phosphate mannosyltransferase